MNRKAIGGGVYAGDNASYWARPWINGRRTWRKLQAVKPRAAMREANTTPWAAVANNFADLAALYSESDCPNKKLEPRPDKFCKPERARIRSLKQFFGTMAADSIRLANLPAYAKWRLRQSGRGTRQRAVDKDLQTLSNILNYGVAIRHLDFNYIRTARPRYRKAADVRHCRKVAPADADVIHKIADYLFDNIRSEVLAWQLLFTEFTGCRTNEILRFRIKAQSPDEPGYIQNGYLFISRSKDGVNPWIKITPELQQLLDCFFRWHRKRHPKSPWYFPSRIGSQAIGETALNHALDRACEHFNLPKITPHGVRSFYVTKRRSDGADDRIIAGEIGDETVELMQTTYGARPDSWSGGEPLSWVPRHGLPAYFRWQDPRRKVARIK